MCSLHFTIASYKDHWTNLPGFLWRGNPNTALGAKVQWPILCFPRNEGGLGLRDLSTLNTACVLKRLWLILINMGSIWAAWVTKYLLKFKCVWLVILPSNCTWSWRKLMNLCIDAYWHISCRIGDGHSFYLWLNNWLGAGALQISSTKWLSFLSLDWQAGETGCNISGIFLELPQRHRHYY